MKRKVKVRTNKDFENSVEFWRDLAKMRQVEINKLNEKLYCLRCSMEDILMAVDARTGLALGQIFGEELNGKL